MTVAWLEPVLVVTRLTDLAPVALGEATGQPAVVRCTGTSLVVLPTGLRDDVAAEEFPCSWSSDTGASCPVRVDDDPQGRCVSVGGGWTGSALHAGLFWQSHRSAALALLGCGVCRGGRGPSWGPRGRPIGGGFPSVPSPTDVLSSRHGGCAQAAS